MTLVKFNQKPVAGSFNNLVDDFFREMPSILRTDYSFPVNQAIPVNIRENENEFVLEIAAPGWNKEDFQIKLEKDLLTVSIAENTKTDGTDEEKGQKFIRREFKRKAFNRSFSIDENIDSEKIVANYLNGVLTLNLPKKAAVKTPSKQITVQ